MSETGLTLAKANRLSYTTHSGYIFLRELVCCVGDEKTGFSYGTITDNHTFDGLHSDLRFVVRRATKRTRRAVERVLNERMISERLGIPLSIN